MQQDVTIDYYNQNAKQYISRTFSNDISGDRNRFLNHLPKSAKILDAGCGSGRDAKAFQSLGFDVSAVDAAEEMVKHAAELGIEAHLMKIEEIPWKNRFDGIWCSASLLHIPKEILPMAIEKLRSALKQEGILFVSFKMGAEDVFENGRYFHMMDETNLLSYFHSFALLDMWSEKSDMNLVPTTWLKAVFKLRND